MINKRARLSIALLCPTMAVTTASAQTLGGWQSTGGGLPYVTFTVLAGSQGQERLGFVRGIGAAYCMGDTIIQSDGRPLPVAGVVEPADAPIVNNRVAFSTRSDPFLKDAFGAMSGTMTFTSDTSADVTFKVYSPLYSGPQAPPGNLVTKICSTHTVHIKAQPTVVCCNAKTTSDAESTASADLVIAGVRH